jgi:hypothetical protein
MRPNQSKIAIPIRTYLSLYERRAWTGGDCPRPWRETSLEERLLCRVMFREQFAEAGHRWGLVGDAKRVFWNRARHDAFRTLNP